MQKKKINTLEDHFKCIQCLNFPSEPLEAQCCGVIFCQACYETALTKKKRCPSCKIIGFKSRPCLLAKRVIGTFKAECKYNCAVVLTFAQKQEHEQICPFRLINCKLCKGKVTVRELYEHMREKHLKNLYPLIVEYCIGQEQIRKMESLKLSKVGKSSSMRNIQIKKMNENGDLATFGESGKYYCGRKNLIGRCVCCDGSCGPTNGENCDACMKLDIEHYSLPRGFLINTTGIVCKKGQGGKFECGRAYKKNFCHENPDNRCPGCFVMTTAVNKLGRYSRLI